MRQEPAYDLRVWKTLAIINQSFRKLVTENGYADLTVAALCAEAHIARKTFYVYYKRLDDLMEAALENIVKKYAKAIENYKLPEDAREVVAQFFQFSIARGKFYNNLVLSGQYQDIAARLLMRLAISPWDSSPLFASFNREERDILPCFFYNTCAGLYRQWIVSGKKSPLEDMINYSGMLLAEGMEGFKAKI